MRAPKSEHEPRRLAALQGYGVLDTPPEEAFDEIALLAARVRATPMASVALVDGERRWFALHAGAGSVGRELHVNGALFPTAVQADTAGR